MHIFDPKTRKFEPAKITAYTVYKRERKKNKEKENRSGTDQSIEYKGYILRSEFFLLRVDLISKYFVVKGCKEKIKGNLPLKKWLISK